MRNSSGTVLWSVSITATFTYDGTTSRCISCSPSATAPATTWSIKSISSSKTGTLPLHMQQQHIRHLVLQKTSHKVLLFHVVKWHYFLSFKALHTTGASFFTIPSTDEDAFASEVMFTGLSAVTTASYCMTGLFSSD